jgi:hypothetical protein
MSWKVFALGALASFRAACGQDLVLIVTDRANDSVWRLHDANGNYVIDEPGEVKRWFGPGNASGLPGVLNPNAVGAVFNECDDTPFDPPPVLVGDQDATARRIYWNRDLNGDGDAMDVDEAGVFADITTGVGQWFAFPVGIINLSNGPAIIVNAGNGFGPDAIWRCQGSNLDDDVNDPGETTPLVTDNGFSTSNGSFSPQEIVFGTDQWLYLRNSSANLHGIWRIDSNAPQFTLWYGDGNSSGFTMGAGFAIDVDRARPGSLYYHSLATGGVDQVFRVTDVNNDGDAMDDGEAVLVWSTAEAGFASVDVCCLMDGSVLVTDNSGLRIIRLRDADNDGLFTSPGERTTFFANSSGLLGEVRSIALVTHQRNCRFCDTIDFNNDGLFPDTADIDDFLSVFSGGPCSTDPVPGCNGIDYNNDGLFPDTLDIDSLLSVFAGGPCL